MNLKEVLPELPSPLTLSAFLRSYVPIFRAQYRRMGYPLPEEAELIRVFYGRPYFNMNIFLKILSDFGCDLDLFQQAMGGFHTDLIDREKLKPPLFTRLKMLPTLMRLMVLYKRIDRISKESFSAIREKFEVDSTRSLAGLSDGELLAYLQELEEFAGRYDLTLIAASFAQSAYWRLRDFLQRTLEEEDVDVLINQLVTASENLISAGQNLRVMELAAHAAKDQRIQEALEKGHIPAEIQGTGFYEALQKFLEEFGHRGVYEGALESPRYREDPVLILSLVKTYLKAGMTDPREFVQKQKNIAQMAHEQVLERIQRKRFSFIKKRLFASLLENYKKFLALREENRFHTAMLMALFRQGDLEVGRRMRERNLIETREDVFYLTVPELQEFLAGKGRDYRETVTRRKQEMEENSRVKVPDTVLGDFTPEELQVGAVEPKKVFSGYAASSGRIRGKARVIRSPEEFERFHPGEVLVAPATDPQWSVLFLVARAVVTEMGGILSHASIVAREYGIPCVVNVRGITDAVKDGDLIEVDGEKGVVKIG